MSTDVQTPFLGTHLVPLKAQGPFALASAPPALKLSLGEAARAARAARADRADRADRQPGSQAAQAARQPEGGSRGGGPLRGPAGAGPPPSCGAPPARRAGASAPASCDQ